MKSPIRLYILNGIALLGVGASIALTQHFYEVRNGTLGFKSYCNISQTLNCDVISASPYAELPGGLPLSSLAAGWFLALFFISLFAHNRFWLRETLRACFGMTLVGTITSLIYLGIMAVKLKTFCLLCLGIDALNILGLITTLSLRPEGFSQHRPDLAKWKVFLLVFLGSIGISMLGLRSLEGSSFPESQISEAAQGILESPVVPVNSSEEFLSIGPKTAPITIVEFSDFQCPWCRMAAFTIHSVSERYPGKIRIVFRNYPLDRTCNREVQQTAHPFACEAARAAVCAGKQGQFERIYEQLFEQQTTLVPGKIFEIGKDLGLHLDLLRDCMESPKTRSAITRDVEEAIKLGIKSTPTFFINGHRVEGAMPSQVWIKVIDKL